MRRTFSWQGLARLSLTQSLLVIAIVIDYFAFVLSLILMTFSLFFKKDFERFSLSSLSLFFFLPFFSITRNEAIIIAKNVDLR